MKNIKNILISILILLALCAGSYYFGYYSCNNEKVDYKNDELDSLSNIENKYKNRIDSLDSVIYFYKTKSEDINAINFYDSVYYNNSKNKKELDEKINNIRNNDSAKLDTILSGLLSETE